MSCNLWLMLESWQDRLVFLFRIIFCCDLVYAITYFGLFVFFYLTYVMHDSSIIVFQLLIDQVTELDLNRTFVFTFLGLVLVGPALHFW